MSLSGSWKFTPEATALVSQLINFTCWMTGLSSGAQGGPSQLWSAEQAGPGGAEQVEASGLQEPSVHWEAGGPCCTGKVDE